MVVSANLCDTAVQMVSCPSLTKNVEEHWNWLLSVSTIFSYAKGNLNSISQRQLCLLHTADVTSFSSKKCSERATVAEAPDWVAPLMKHL